ncbi:MCE family protein [Mycobacteroides abscessus]|uniref:MCE family protein n=1 Tax=Mycobacteroides abscessus TaxID=36809 RepID=UPI000241D559|nr:MlaD family protein [Mycobacteroides abscessus]EHM14965.1 virulence factor Mce family protein [Mycobacteroides abscessus subsp. bolletii BD]ORA30882.1 virulence factor Mce [Mycobacteroides abscessus subsp. bolletii]TPF67659.1 virulence factor Mce [Mycobacteroides abscessus subsp. bolletii]BBB43923.1 virulence factor Mce [Mycobacteroides abscessus subsp. bolletii BD]
MLTGLIRTQLAVFAAASIIGMAVMVIVYMQAPALLGIGRMRVTLELPSTGGLYRLSNVTYRGVEIGKVTDVSATRDGAVATLSLKTTPKIPADLHANVLSISAVGEQYVDLQPRTDVGPYLNDGAVIHKSNTTVPQAVGPMLDQLDALIDSVPKDKLGVLLDETFNAFQGTRYDTGSLLDSTSKLSDAMRGVQDQSRDLIDNSRALLDGQAESADALRIWAHSLAGITGQIAADEPQVRTLLHGGADAAAEASHLINQVEPTVPVLLANLATLGQVAVTYHPALEQLLVLLPPDIAATQSYGLARNNPTGFSLGDFTLTLNDPPACTVGFLPPSSWRSPADLSEIDTPNGLYCKLPQDSPIGVRGARNYPCMNHPGKRAPTAEICESDKPFEPLAMRQHALGPYPVDPSLISQGYAPDDRVDFSDRIFGPIGGTPPPAQTSSTPPPSNPQTSVPAPTAGPPSTAPSAFTAPSSTGPSVAIARYDPRTGQYAAPGGQVYRQADLANAGAPRSWKDLLPT